MWDSIESVLAAAQVLDYAGGAGFDHGEGVVKPVEAAVPGVGHVVVSIRAVLVGIVGAFAGFVGVVGVFAGFMRRLSGVLAH